MNENNHILLFNIFANISANIFNMFARYCGARVSQRFSVSVLAVTVDTFITNTLFFIPCGVHRLAPVTPAHLRRTCEMSLTDVMKHTRTHVYIMYT